MKDRFTSPTPFGYSDVLINVVMPDGSYAEIQISTPEMLAAKELGHKLYDVMREDGSTKSCQARATKISKLIYASVRPDTSAANSDSEIGVPFMPATAAGNLRGSGTNATASSMSGDKATAFSSTSKSAQPFAAKDFQSSDIFNTFVPSVSQSANGFVMGRL